MMDPVAPGARVVIRDAEWLVRKVDATSTGGYAIHTIGLSELVKNREAIFLSELERDITVMDQSGCKFSGGQTLRAAALEYARSG